jgi:hypothetical protein
MLPKFKDTLSKRFVVSALHTNMQVWGHVRGLGGALRKFKRRGSTGGEGIKQRPG